MAQFIVNYTFHGRATDEVQAASLEEAKRIVADRIEQPDFEVEADEIDCVDFYVQEMHAVTRNGQKLWTSYVRSDDVRGHGEAA